MKLVEQLLVAAGQRRRGFPLCDIVEDQPRQSDENADDRQAAEQRSKNVRIHLTTSPSPGARPSWLQAPCRPTPRPSVLQFLPQGSWAPSFQARPPDLRQNRRDAPAARTSRTRPPYGCRSAARGRGRG